MRGSGVREALVRAGVLLLHERGFNGCGVQDIAVAAGVPKGSFYNHFPSKEAFGVEVVERYRQEHTARLAVLADISIPPLERLHRYFRSQVDTLVEWEYRRGSLLGNLAAEMSDHSTVIRERLAATLSAWSRAIGHVIEQAKAAGEISSDTAADTLAAVLLNAWEGAVLHSRIEKSRRALDAFLDTSFTKLLA
jgi:TetR/AcrR family transcriptional repressor of nem operon